MNREAVIKWLNLRPGELRPFVLCIAGSFFLFAFMVLSRSLAEASYLFNFSVKTLPYVTAGYVLLAIPTVGWFSQLLTKYRPKKVMIWLLLLLVTGVVALSPFLTISASAVVVFYIWVTLGQCLLSSGFWIVTAEQFDLRGAKRLYGFVTAGGTLGAMVMGISIGTFKHEESHAIFLLVLTIMFFLLALYFLPESSLSEQEEKKSSTKEDFSWRESLSLVWKSRHLRTLAVIVVLASMASTLVDYQFKESARASLETRAQLTGYLATVYGWMGAISLVIHLLAGLFLANAGLSMTLSILPLFLIGGSASLLFFPSLRWATFVRGADYSLRKSLHRTAIEIAYVPVSPEVRKKTKTFIDSVMDASAEGLGSFIIFAWIIVGNFPSRYLSIFVMTLGGGLLFASWRMGKYYFQTLEERLMQEQQEPEQLFAQARSDRTNLLAATFSDRNLQKLRDIRRFHAKHKTQEGQVHPVPAPAKDDVSALVGLLAQNASYKKAASELLAREDVAFPLLIKSLADEESDLTLARRIPHVLAQSKNFLVNDTLVAALRNRRFEIRYRAAAALMRRKREGLFILGKKHEAEIWAAIEAEVHHDRPVWEMQQLLEDTDPEADSDGLVATKVGVRGALSLEHTFRLLSLVLASDLVQSTFNGLVSGNVEQRGFALEYLEHALPENICKLLWPFIGDLSEKEQEKSTRPVDQVVSELSKSSRTLFSGDTKAKETLEEIAQEIPDKTT